MRFFFISLLLFMLSSCQWFSGAATPLFKWSGIKIPDGPPTFQQGFKDGCSTVLYSRGNVFYRNRYGYRYDPKMIGNPEYRFGHSRGYTWCLQNIMGTAPMASFDRYLNPSGAASGYGVFDMTTADMGVAWGGMFGSSPMDVVSGGASIDGNFDLLSGGSGGGAFSANPLWAGGSKGQLFGQ